MTAVDEPLVTLGRMLLGLDRDQLEALFAEMTPEDADVYERALAQADLESFIAGREAGELRDQIERDGPTWMRALFPTYARAAFAPHMRDAWEWAWSIRRGVRTRPRVDAWFRGASKALAVDTPIPTPTGWLAMGDILPGHTVFDHSGRPVRVLSVSPVEDRPAYRVTFKGGGSVVASGDHLWAVVDRATRRVWGDAPPPDWPTWAGNRAGEEPCGAPGCDGTARRGSRWCSAHGERLRVTGDLQPDRPVRRLTARQFETLRTSVLTTEEIIERGLAIGSNRDWTESQWAVPVAGSLDLPDAWLPIDPYLLGVWLGDGTSANGQITVGVEDFAATRALLEHQGRTLAWHERPSGHVVTVGGLHGDLRRLGLLGNKHIPAAYLRSGEKQRLSLLQGLLDTDGHVARSAASFTSTREGLARGCAELARSLGMRAAVAERRAVLNGRDCGPAWVVRIVGRDRPLFRLQRKVQKHERAKAASLNAALHYMQSIEPVGTVPVRCIVVDSPGHCFLAGDAMIPTHNSTTAETITAALGARRVRRYALYVSGTQNQADKHVETIGAMLESPRFAALYPEMASRAVGKYGTSKGWSRTRLYTASGFVVDALGLQVSARGIRIEEDRPDLIILDDVDDLEDGLATVEKKIDLITSTILPSGSPDLAVLAIQNIIHPTSIFARLVGMAEERADWLADRIVVGPIPAAEGLDVEVVEEEGRFRYVVRGGTPTWEGYGLPEIQAAIDTYGYSSFLREAQHEVEAKPGGMFDHLNFRHARRQDVPPIVRWSCWVDPAVTDTDRSDSQGIQLDGRGSDGELYRFFSWEARTSPQRALTLAIRTAVDYGCGKVGVETDQGGDTWYSVYREACDAVRKGEDGGEPIPQSRMPGFDHDKAGAGYGGKVHRASQMLAAYERAQAPIHVLGTHEVLERGLRRYPRTKPLDLVDAAWWSWHELDEGGETRMHAPEGNLERPAINTRSQSSRTGMGRNGDVRLGRVSRLR